MKSRLPLALVLLCAEAALSQTHHDVIRADVQYQVIENFGASDAWRMRRSARGRWLTAKSVADLLFSQDKGIGLSCWRFNIGGGIHPQITMPWRTVETFETGEDQYDWTRQANERWFRSAARQRGVPQFLAFVVSPPITAGLSAPGCGGSNWLARARTYVACSARRFWTKRVGRLSPCT